MPASWLYKIGADGLFVAPEIVAGGDATVLRTLNRQPLSKLYRANYSRPRRDDAIGLFWLDVPPLRLIPFIRGRDSPAAWVKDHIAFVDEPASKQHQKRTAKALYGIARRLSSDQHLAVKWTEGGKKVVATMMKPHPQFDLVVVNRYDRAALLKLLGELDVTASIRGWMSDRTMPGGATAPSVLHVDYVAWCERESEAAAGIKGFAQGLIAAGVAKLPRSAGSVRYQLQLR